MVVKQYPYMLRVLVTTGGGTDEDGNPIPETKEFIDYAKCRDESNDDGNQVQLVDGEAIIYEVLIQLPNGTEPVAMGTAVLVEEPDGYIRFAGTVKRFRKDQMHSRLWA